MDEVNLYSMTEEERKSYFVNKKGYRINKPTFKIDLIMRRLKKRYAGTDRFKGLTDNMMCKIVNRIMELKVQRLYLDGYIDLEYGLGIIYMKPVEAKNKDFKSVSVNYKKTIEYWAKNIEAYKKGIVIRNVSSKKRLPFHWHRNKDGNLKYYTFQIQKVLGRKVYKDYINNKPMVFIEFV